MTLAAKALPSPCVFDITVDAEFVHISWHPGRLFELGNDEPLTGRQSSAGRHLVAQTDIDEDGEFTRIQIDGCATDNARDALIWASELAQGSKGEFRRAIEASHAVIVAALTQPAPGMPVDFTWRVTSRERYIDQLEVLFPAEATGACFLMGETIDHRGDGGLPRFNIHRVSDGLYYEGSRPVTRAEFRQLTLTL